MTPAELLEINQRIQRAGAANCWTGTLGSLAADARRLVRHIEERNMAEEYAADQILQGERELRAPYTGDEMECWRDAVQRTPPKLRPLTSVVPDPLDTGEVERRQAEFTAVDEIDSRKAAMCSVSVSTYTPPPGTPYTPLLRPASHAPDIHPTSQKYVALLDKLKALHLSKSHDYGTSDDPLANIRNGASFVGIPPWKACLVRLSDKVTRIQTYCSKGTLFHEGVDDSFLDLAAYALLTLLLHQEAAAPPHTPPGDCDD